MEPPLSETSRLGGKGYQRDGAISRFSDNDFILLDFHIFFKDGYFDSLIILDFYIFIKLLI
jgi:hypothetical protein